MAKILNYANGSPMSVKIGDTDTSLYLVLKKDDASIDLTAASSINLKVADSQHAYIKTVSIDISDQSDLANGYLTIDLNDALISGLPSGTYYFEMWVNIDNETEIYPDSGFKSFVIKNNIEQGSSSYTTITLNDISAKLTETANTLQANVEQSIKDEISNGDFKGDKGDTGTVDNTGLTNAPAFQALQTQVNNSAVGTNLLLNSAGTFQPSSSQIDNNMYLYDSTVTLSKGVKYTLSAKTNGVFSSVHDTTVDSDRATIWLFSNDKGWQLISDENTATGTTFTLDQYGLSEGEYYIRINGYHVDNSTWVKDIKIEKGSVATDWCPNPSEVLTTANYNKLVAAIVALGGSV